MLSEINIELAIGLFQWFSFAAMLGPYFKSFESSDYGNKPIRFAIPELKRNRFYQHHLLLVPLALRNLLHHIAFVYLHLVTEVSF